MQRDDMIGNMGRRINGAWHWELHWRRSFFVWEEEQYREFLDVIAPFIPSDLDDRWLWVGDDMQGFTVNSAYLLLVAKFIPTVVMDPVMEFVLNIFGNVGCRQRFVLFLGNYYLTVSLPKIIL
jgi:hypothetical protein